MGDPSRVVTSGGGGASPSSQGRNAPGEQLTEADGASRRSWKHLIFWLDSHEREKFPDLLLEGPGEIDQYVFLKAWTALLKHSTVITTFSKN